MTIKATPATTPHGTKAKRLTPVDMADPPPATEIIPPKICSLKIPDKHHDTNALIVIVNKTVLIANSRLGQHTSPKSCEI